MPSESRVLLAVRLVGSTKFLSLAADINQASTRRLPVSVSNVGEILVRDTDGCSHADVALDPSIPGRAAIVDCDGGVWIWKGDNGNSEL